MSPRTLCAAAFCLATLACASAARAEPWTFGAFQIDWPDGYVHQDDPDLDQFVNADGVGVTVEVLGHGKMTSQDEQASVHRWQSYGHDQLVGMAARHGDVVIPLRDEKLASGLELLSVADQHTTDTSKTFGLFFLLISPDGRIVQITVEGPGTADDRMGEFRPAINTARWTAAAAPKK
ncbi:MAG TPA: hypothetical protein VHY34_05610 [Caulobacteraceae bacterium]|nr:hypothetical protein [Caulobacteraceae bacterium]